MEDNLGLALFLILRSQRVLLTSFSAESIHQEVLVVVLLTDYHVTTCNKCNVIKDVDGRLVITMTLTIAIYEIKHINFYFPFVYFDFRFAFH